ncbi:MAG: hypothetical protein V4507_08500 [Verrucomicrobiota bacterium]
MSLPEFLICLALALAGMGLFNQPSSQARKWGLIVFWLGSGVGIYFITGKIAWGAFVLLAWILVPLAEMMVVLRKLRLPHEREFRDAVPPITEFPTLREITREYEDLGFKKVDDCDLTPHFHETYYRLFHHSEHPSHGVIGFISQGEIGFSFHAFFSEQTDGKIWLTWDYPLTYGLKTPPNISIYRLSETETIEELWKEHLAFLEINQVAESSLILTSTAEEIRDRLARSLNRQLEYNIHEGILLPEVAQDLHHLRYSWRGIWFVTRQMARDLLGWS